MNYLLLRLPLVILLIVFSIVTNTAQTPPRLRLLKNYITGLSQPVLYTSAFDGTKRMFVVEQRGTIRVVQPGSQTPSDYLNIGSLVWFDQERGLFGLAFHPDFENNGYFFVNYIRLPDGATVISRFKESSVTGLGDPNSERILFVIPQPYSNHKGGMIAFGQDQNLYIGMGDGGGIFDPENRSQNKNELLGKFLRVTPDVSGNDLNPPYAIPPDNPFVGSDGLDEIFAVGVRNPWRWSFDRRGTNQLYAADVGQFSVEEANVITRGGNYGWRVYEGNECTNIEPDRCAGGAAPIVHTPPIFQYRSDGTEQRCSITGGYVYRGVQNARPDGEYLYADFCTGEILSWSGGQQTVLLDTDRMITSFGEDENGELYIVGIEGNIDKVLGRKASADFDGDLHTDISVFRPSQGLWYTLDSQTNQARSVGWGLPGDIPVPADYDGDHITDIAVFRPSTGVWYYLRSSDGSYSAVGFGAAEDIPATGDYDGDGRTEFAVFRPSTGIWYLLRSSDSGVLYIPFGLSGDVPTAGDYDGDGKSDISVWRPSNGVWYRLNSTTGEFVAVPWGLAGDIPVSEDFDGDYKNDLTVFRPADGLWYINRSSDRAFQTEHWGVEGDIPVAGDYDADGKGDLAVFRPATGTWYISRSWDKTISVVGFGLTGDLPAPKYETR